MKKIFFIFLQLTLTAFAIPVFAHTFAGTYECTGFDPYLNKNYSGSIEVVQQNSVYKIKMKYNTGETYRATGGQYNDELLSVVFQDPSNLKVVGLEQYRWFTDKDAIGGYWVYLGQDKLGTEVCTKVKK